MACSLQGLIRFQSTWREIAEGMGLVSKRVRSSDPEFAAKVRERTLAESLPELETAAQRLENIIEETRQYTGAVSLDISHGSMASRTAEGFYKTLVNGANYLREYFIHIGEDDLYDLVKVKALRTRMLEGFFGHITEKIQGNNRTFLEFTKHVATEAFHFMVPVARQDWNTPKVLALEEQGMKYRPHTLTQLKITTVVAIRIRQCGQCFNNATNKVSLLQT